MALVFRQVAVGTAPTFVGAVPPGACTIVLAGGSAVTYIGASSLTLAAQGVPLAAGAVMNIPCYATSAPFQLYAAGTAASTNIGFILSTGM